MPIHLECAWSCRRLRLLPEKLGRGMNRKMIAPIICYHWLGPFLLDTPAHTCENADGQGPTLEAVSRKLLIYFIFGLYIDQRNDVVIIERASFRLQPMV